MTKIGLEIHCQLTNLESKLFCSCKANYREFSPNTNICPICVGLPGTLPRLNKKAVEKSTMISIALNCETPDKIAFFRKNYFYPDLPKNFQITQLDAYGPTSIGHDGKITIEDKEIRIRRIQIEEDPGRLIYEGASEKTQITLVDYNRAGTPLVEIVTEPDFENPKQVRLFLNILVDLLSNLGVSDPTLEGALRADGNVSVKGGNKVEIKNVSSFHDLEKAIHFEITRQQSLVERKISVISETRQWDEKRKITVSARTKEEEQDYRFFLEGDIPWVRIDEKIKTTLRKNMPESINIKQNRLIEEYGINPQVANIISTNKIVSKSFDNIYETCVPKRNVSNFFLFTDPLSSTQRIERPDPDDPKVKTKYGNEIANLLTNTIMSLQNFQKSLLNKEFEKSLAYISSYLVNDIIPKNTLNEIIHKINDTNQSVFEIIKKLDLQKISDIGILLKSVEEVFNEESDAVREAKNNPEIINFLVGKVMRKTKGRADPERTLELIKEKLHLNE